MFVFLLLMKNVCVTKRVGDVCCICLSCGVLNPAIGIGSCSLLVIEMRIKIIFYRGNRKKLV